MKTKTQLLAERTVFKQLLIAVIAASAEPELSDPDDDFVPNLCRHFAMLFTVEPPNPPGGRGGSKDAGPAHPPGGKRGKNEPPAQSAVQSIMAAANLKELDPLLFLDALVAVLADDHREQAKVRARGSRSLNAPLRKGSKAMRLIHISRSMGYKKMQAFLLLQAGLQLFRCSFWLVGTRCT